MKQAHIELILIANDLLKRTEPLSVQSCKALASEIKRNAAELDDNPVPAQPGGKEE